MSIKFACDCGKAYKVPDTFSGKRVKCKQCGEPIRVPSQSQSGVASSRASAVTKRSVLNSQRLAGTSGRGSASSASSARTSARTSAGTSTSTRARAGGGGTRRVKVVDLTEGNQLKRYQKKKDEEFARGEARLTFFGDDGKPVKAFRVNKKGGVVGRSESCAVTIPVDSVSDEHMKLEYKLGTFISTDLSSANGMVINGRVVRRCSLKSGDVIQLGEAVLRFDC